MCPSSDDTPMIEHMVLLASGVDVSMLDELGVESLGEGGGLFAVLAVLALIDSTSFGTLLIPVWLMLARGRLRASRVVIYLLTVAGAYAVIGVVLLTSLLLVGDDLMVWFAGTRDQPAFLGAQLALGIGMVAYSFRMDPMTAAGKERKRQRDEARGSTGRVERFRTRALGDDGGGLSGLFGLAFLAVGLEIATLLPYLAGIGMVAAEGPGMPTSAGYLLFYCAMMIAPATVLLLGRLVAARLLAGPLERLEGFLSRHANGTIALILFLFGAWMSLNAAGALGLT